MGQIPANHIIWEAKHSIKIFMVFLYKKWHNYQQIFAVKFLKKLEQIIYIVTAYKKVYSKCSNIIIKIINLFKILLV